MLCILGILLLAILIVLCVPVRYRIELNREEGEGKPPFVVRAKITWLLHFVNILIQYPSEKAYVRVRLFIFTLFRAPEKQVKDSARSKQNKKSVQNKKVKQKKTKSESEASDTQPTETESGNIDTQPIRTESKGTEPSKRDADAREILNDGTQKTIADKQQQSEEQSNAPDMEEQDTVQKSNQRQTINAERDKELPTVTISAQKQAEQKTKRKKSKRSGLITSLKQKLQKIFEKIKTAFHKIKDLFQNIQYTIRNFCDKIRSISEQIRYYRELIASDVFQQSFQLCKGELAYIFKKIKPQKMEADLIIGMDDPAVTGEILAIYGMLYPFIGEHVNVAGDFEQNRIEGHVFIKGRIRAVTFVRTAIRIYFNKDIRKLIKLLKKEAV